MWNREREKREKKKCGIEREKKEKKNEKEEKK
jgi:hypothetical protein